MNIYIGADHRGFKIKEALKSYLAKKDIAVIDVGADKLDPNDDYPIFAEKVAGKVASDINNNQLARGIVICGSGVGVDIVANKFKHIRSGVAVNAEQVKKARSDDDINVLAVPAEYIEEQNIELIVELFLETPFSEKERYKRRISEIEEIEDEQ